MYLVFFLISIFVCVHAAPVGKSPCQGQFEYQTGEKDVPGQWAGTLNIQPEYKLYGTWIRLIFDGPIKSVDVEGDSSLTTALYDEKPGNEILIKNRDFILKKGELVKIPFTVKYEGEKTPNFVGYRLNGRDVCPGLE